MLADLTQAAVLAAEIRGWLKYDKYSKAEVEYSKLSEIAKLLDSKIAASFRELNYKEKQQINELVTVELIKTGLIKVDNPIQPEITPASEDCPEPFYWSAYDGVATEVEVLEFLYAFVRMVKPKFILETGTYLGHGAVYMALAQKRNGFGNLISCDTDKEALKKAVSLAMQNDIALHINFVLRHGVDVIKQLDDRSVDLVFIDSGDEQTRIEEINSVVYKLTSNGFLLVHDINKLKAIKTHLDFLRLKTVFDGLLISCTPRGLAVFQKV